LKAATYGVLKCSVSRVDPGIPERGGCTSAVHVMMITTEALKTQASRRSRAIFSLFCNSKHP